MTVPVIIETDLRSFIGRFSSSACSFAPTAAVAGIAAQIMHIATP